MPTGTPTTTNHPGILRTYAECRTRFLEVAHGAGASVTRHPLRTTGPDGLELTIDVAVLGAPTAPNRLLVLSGVHGVEGFAPSAIQCELLDRLADPSPDLAIVVVHAVNPWGMAWWRRQNESNVDLNRNWGRDRGTAPANDGYDDLHELLVPDSLELPTADSFLGPVRVFVERHGTGWVVDAVSRGQYRHDGGLYFGGHVLEESTTTMRAIAETHLFGAERVLTVDLHTGHGSFGTATLLAQVSPGSAPDRWVREHFAGERIEATLDNATPASPRPKVGMLSVGLADVLTGTEYHAVTFELGTVGGTRMILAERAEHWVHFHGDRADPVHAAVVWEHRVCSTPDDRDWERRALDHGRRVLDLAVAGLTG